MSHTPGPWQIAPHSDAAEVLEIVSEYRESRGMKSAHWIAECDLQETKDGHDIDYETNAANAHLIAAAPELLDALKAALEWLPDPRPHRLTDPDGLEAVIRQCEAAIKKAEGR